MFEVYREIVISASHRLSNYEGKCGRIHGHNWRIGLWVRAEELDEQGMVTDFCQLKEALNEVADHLDHRDLNVISPFDVIGPTAENMARWIFEQTSRRVNTDRLRVFRVQVWETPLSCAAYQAEPC